MPAPHVSSTRGWSTLQRPGCVNVDVKVLLEGDDLLLALLRFREQATIDEHDAPYEIDVICLEGSGYTSIAGEVAALSEGEHVRWPPRKLHRLWTAGTTMQTLMVERRQVRSG